MKLLSFIIVVIFFSCSTDRVSIVTVSQNYVKKNKIELQELLNQVKNLNKKEAVSHIDYSESVKIYTIFFEGSNNFDYYKFLKKDIDTDSILEKLNAKETINLMNKLDVAVVDITEQGVEILAPKYANLYTNTYKIIPSDFSGEVPVEKMLKNYYDSTENEWAYKLDETWMLVNLGSNL